MKRILLLPALVLGILLSQSSAYAAFKVKLSTGSGSTTTVSDDDGFNVDPLDTGIGAGTAGVISFGALNLGGFRITVTLAESKPEIGSAAAPAMHLNYVVTKLSGSPADTLTILVTDTGFTPLPLGLVTNLGGASGANPPAQVLYQAYTSTSNTEFDITGGDTTSTSFSSIVPAANSDYSFGPSILPNPASAPYSITMSLFIDGAAGSMSTSGDVYINTVPAPAGLVLVLSGMPIVGLGAWFRRRRT
jgi:hypothetical protein